MTREIFVQNLEPSGQPMKFSTDDILKLYESEAKKHGEGGTSTIQDMRTRVLEMRAIFSYIRDGMTVLEIGCGNGYVAEALARQFAVDMDASDFSADMVNVAVRRDLSGARGKVRFFQESVLDLHRPAKYDLVFTERCIQNLTTWDAQKDGLRRIVESLKSRGEYIMLESFWTGLNNLNAARQEVGLAPIPESWHNRFFDEPETRQHMESLDCELVEQNCFLSGYYFGSRVLLPAISPKDKAVSSASILNDFFCGLPASGDFSPMKILRFRKR